jgi:predicted SAM-dependent methyltransferase
MQPSYCLHDDGEESWPVKLHLGNGGIYLQGYINVDIDGVLAQDNRALQIQNTTDIQNYYARLDGDPNHLPMRRATVCDLIDDITSLPFLPSSVDKIVAIQVFEHLPPAEAMIALTHWREILWHGQPLVMSVPDMEGTLDMLDTDYDFALRHLRGRKGDYANSHHAWYTKAGLCGLLKWLDFRVEVLDNFHFYPALVVRAIKQ